MNAEMQNWRNIKIQKKIEYEQKYKNISARRKGL